MRWGFSLELLSFNFPQALLNLRTRMQLAHRSHLPVLMLTCLLAAHYGRDERKPLRGRKVSSILAVNYLDPRPAFYACHVLHAGWWALLKQQGSADVCHAHRLEQAVVGIEVNGCAFPLPLEWAPSHIPQSGYLKPKAQPAQ